MISSQKVLANGRQNESNRLRNRCFLFIFQAGDRESERTNERAWGQTKRCMRWEEVSKKKEKGRESGHEKGKFPS